MRKYVCCFYQKYTSVTVAALGAGASDGAVVARPVDRAHAQSALAPAVFAARAAARLGARRPRPAHVAVARSVARADKAAAVAAAVEQRRRRSRTAPRARSRRHASRRGSGTRRRRTRRAPAARCSALRMCPRCSRRRPSQAHTYTAHRRRRQTARRTRRGPSTTRRARRRGTRRTRSRRSATCPSSGSCSRRTDLRRATWWVDGEIFRVICRASAAGLRPAPTSDLKQTSYACTALTVVEFGAI